jgi:hypothetical protein
MPIEQSCGIGAHSKEEGMSKIHLAGKTGKQIPTRGQYGKDTGESEDAQEVRILGKHRQEEKKEEKEYDDDPGRKDKDFVFKHGEKLSQVK